MFQKAFSFAVTVLLAGAMVLMMPGLSQAQRGGGHSGGGHFGGGGGHFGGGSSHFAGGGGHFSGAHYGYGRYRPSYRGYGYYPYYGLYGGYYPYYGTSSPTYDWGYYGSYGDSMPSYSDAYPSVTPATVSDQSGYPPDTAQPDTSAHVTVSVPAGARLWFDGTATTSTGSVREFNSPPLTPGSRYMYEVRARWNENGHEVTQTHQVEVTAGAHVDVDFPLPSKTAGQASAVKKG